MSDIPSPRATFIPYTETFTEMEVGQSFSFAKEARPLVQSAARRLGLDITIAKHDGEWRVWLEGTYRYGLADEVFAVLSEWATVADESEWTGAAAEIQLVLSPRVRHSAKQIGRALAALSRTHPGQFTVARHNPKKGNRYRIDLNALRASRIDPVASTVVASQKVAETSEDQSQSAASVAPVGI